MWCLVSSWQLREDDPGSTSPEVPKLPHPWDPRISWCPDHHSWPFLPSGVMKLLSKLTSVTSGSDDVECLSPLGTWWMEPTHSSWVCLQIHQIWGKDRNKWSPGEHAHRQTQSCYLLPMSQARPRLWPGQEQISIHHCYQVQYRTSTTQRQLFYE